ncbi:hypothetical protein JK358_17090 [Nocardia sp. 2]|uniref:Uncharacterized protein n=1 Tax=Nocardia acididurans TaxID=2802282 RepID=A0ABS1M748_9NOCA|nr:hypothetical protein [Nocardia acididurans]MBL1076116.1 hypothetical protein [Nocardia acididurans]
MYEGLVLGAHLPTGWLWPALILIGLILAAGLLVLLLVSGARFDEPSYTPPSTPGPCEPFCSMRNQAPA